MEKPSNGFISVWKTLMHVLVSSCCIFLDRVLVEGKKKQTLSLGLLQAGNCFSNFIIGITSGMKLYQRAHTLK